MKIILVKSVIGWKLKVLSKPDLVEFEFQRWEQRRRLLGFEDIRRPREREDDLQFRLCEIKKGFLRLGKVR